jgi:hypothetical protein
MLYTLKAILAWLIFLGALSAFMGFVQWCIDVIPVDVQTFLIFMGFSTATIVTTWAILRKVK